MTLFLVSGRHSVKPPDATRVAAGETGQSGDQNWLDWAVASGQIDVESPGQLSPGIRTVFFGDSYTAVSGTQSYDVGADRGAVGYSLWTEMLHGGLAPLANEGVAGENTTQYVARLDDVIAHRPKIVVLMSPGINSVKGSVSLAQIKKDLSTIFSRLTGRGITVVTSTIPPSDLVDTAGEINILFDANRWIIEQSRRLDRLVVIDGYQLMADPTIDSIGYRAGYSSDGTHPNAVGSAILGAALADAINDLFPPTPSLLPASNLDSSELLSNSMATGSGGTEGLPTGWVQVGGTGAVTQEARTDGLPGNWQKWVQTSGTNTVLQDVTSGFDIGDTVRARFELDVVDTSGLAGGAHYVYVEMRSAVPAVIDTIVVRLGVEGDYPETASPITVTTNPIVVPANTATIRVAHRLVGAGTVRLGRMSLRKLD